MPETERSITQVRCGNTELSILAAVKDDDPVGIYLREISKTPLLTKEEEINLFKIISQAKEAEAILIGIVDSKLSTETVEDLDEHAREKAPEGVKAREAVLKANLRFVVSKTKKYAHREDFLDIIQAGNLGLLKAVDKFDLEKGWRFLTYAGWWVKKEVVYYFKNQTRTIRIPVDVQTQIKRMNQVKDNLERKLGRRPTSEEIAVNLGHKNTDSVNFMNQAKKPPFSLDKSKKSDEDYTLMDEIKDALPADEGLDLNLKKASLLYALEKLTYTEKKVIELAHGFYGENFTLKEIGRMLKITQQRVSQIKMKALSKLKTFMQSDLERETFKKEDSNKPPSFKTYYENLKKGSSMNIISEILKKAGNLKAEKVEKIIKSLFQNEDLIIVMSTLGFNHGKILSVKEIAEATEFTEHQIRTRIFNLLKKLSANLELLEKPNLRSRS